MRNWLNKITQPCPWCKGTDFEWTYSVAAGYVAVNCKKCGAHGPRAAKEREAVEKWKFIDQAGYTEGEMFFVLRVFIASEYDRDTSVLERLNAYFKELKEANEGLKKAQ
jgi:hypothetical protein